MAKKALQVSISATDYALSPAERTTLLLALKTLADDAGFITEYVTLSGGYNDYVTVIGKPDTRGDMYRPKYLLYSYDTGIGIAVWENDLDTPLAMEDAAANSGVITAKQTRRSYYDCDNLLIDAEYPDANEVCVHTVIMDGDIGLIASHIAQPVAPDAYGELMVLVTTLQYSEPDRLRGGAPFCPYAALTYGQLIVCWTYTGSQAVSDYSTNAYGYIGCEFGKVDNYRINSADLFFNPLPTTAVQAYYVSDGASIPALPAKVKGVLLPSADSGNFTHLQEVGEYVVLGSPTPYITANYLVSAPPVAEWATLTAINSTFVP